MNKRELVLDVLDRGKKQGYIPAAFFLHFSEAHHRGQAAIEKHLEYFRYTGMDIVKIQYENEFPHRPEIQSPVDWKNMSMYTKEFYEDQLHIVENLVKHCKKDALVIMTLYSPFMCAGSASAYQITDHIKKSPQKAKMGIEIITDSLMIFVKECIRLGIDGFYHSTQGRENFRFDDAVLFEECIKPYDLALMEEINDACLFNILHICDYYGGYDDLTPFLDYPGHVVNCSLELGTGTVTAQEVSEMFGRPYMGGFDRKGIIASGSRDDIITKAEELLRKASSKFILGADCTLPSDIDWDNIKTAISTAHEWEA